MAEKVNSLVDMGYEKEKVEKILTSLNKNLSRLNYQADFEKLFDEKYSLTSSVLKFNDV